ncbi:MAG: DUF29 family protein [Alphaproteobacteria bacterium]|nr:DUF29 family protein [Alphaproteobacteria bacterium]
MRRARAAGSSPDIDWDNLIAEVTDLGDDMLDVAEGLITQILARLLELEFAVVDPVARPRRHWQAEVEAYRGHLRRRVKRAPSALKQIDLAELYADARRIAALSLDRADLPERCPYALQAQVMETGWYPVAHS